ncbi:peptidoglycan-associated lipoprotein [Porphyromonadaceae bacterium NLAE-zl-C104]|nr:peptidoglycan-associated lipoprotein [Porphyromonadaceae bacterium KH3R12]SFS48288.1 peptidoglycan-associated lipoprotein [Porphyromonadaceae bacterium NLAE-zl-C104]
MGYRNTGFYTIFFSKKRFTAKTTGLKLRILYMLLAVIWLLLSCDQAKLSVAREQYLRGEYYAASETYRKLYRNVSREERAQRGIIAFEMAENYRKLNQSSRAVAAYNNAIRYGYPDTIMYFHYARMLHREGNYEGAAEAYRRFLTFRPEDRLALAGLQGVELAVEWSKNPTRYVVERMELFNSNRGEFSPMLSADGDRLYFTSSREEVLGEEKSAITGMKYNDLFRSVKNVHGEWQRPERISSGVNTGYDEGTPSFSPDGEWMYYTFSDINPNRGTTAKIYLSRWVNGRWSEGRPLEIVKDDSLSVFAHPAISPSGRWLYFVSDMPGGYGGKDIWRASVMNNHEILLVENLGPDINTPGDELFPYLRNDTTLYFSSDGHPGMGGLDMFMAVASGGETWRQGRLGDWERGRLGERESGRWRVRNLQSPLNSPADDFGITFEPKGEMGFFSSNRNDVRGYDHIYSFVYPEVTVWIEGFVVDPDDEFIPGAVVSVVGSEGSQLRFVTGKEGEYRFKANRDTDYLLMASADGFLNQKQRLSPSSEEKDTLYYVDFEMIPYNKPVILDNIFYDFDSATLRPESKDELGLLIDLLNEHPSVAIELAAHTDRKGSDEYNSDLSLRRAQSVVNYLSAHGINPQRLSAQGFGKTRPVKVSKKMAEQFDFLKEGDLLTEEFIETLTLDQQEIADQINRRTSFEVIDLEFGFH